MCGVIPGDIDDVTGRTADFHVGHIGEKDEPSTIWVLCSSCYQGTKALIGRKSFNIWLREKFKN